MKILIKFLLVFGLAVNVAFGEGTPLERALDAGNTDEFRRLVKSGADINSSGIAGHVVFYAMNAYPNASGGAPHLKNIDADLLEFLFENGADPNRSTDYEWNLMHTWAEQAASVCQFQIPKVRDTSAAQSLAKANAKSVLNVLAKYCVAPALKSKNEGSPVAILSAVASGYDHWPEVGRCLSEMRNELNQVTANHATCKPPTSSGSTASTGGSVGGSTGSSSSSSSSSTSSSSTERVANNGGMRWVLTDACTKPGVLQAKFFAYKAGSTTPFGSWPGGGDFYSTDNVKVTGETIDVTLDVGAFEKVCYGAALENHPNHWFGVGINGDKRCSAGRKCCATAKPGATEKARLHCPD